MDPLLSVVWKVERERTREEGDGKDEVEKVETVWVHEEVVYPVVSSAFSFFRSSFPSSTDSFPSSLTADGALHDRVGMALSRRRLFHMHFLDDSLSFDPRRTIMVLMYPSSGLIREAGEKRRVSTLTLAFEFRKTLLEAGA